MSWMVFHDDKPVQCEECGELIYPGNSYIKHPNGISWSNFCSEECLKDFLLENAEYEEHYIKTAKDKENEFYESQEGYQE